MEVFGALKNQNPIYISDIFNEIINSGGRNIDIVVPSQNMVIYEGQSITISGTHIWNLRNPYLELKRTYLFQNPKAYEIHSTGRYLLNHLSLNILRYSAFSYRLHLGFDSFLFGTVLQFCFVFILFFFLAFILSSMTLSIETLSHILVSFHLLQLICNFTLIIPE